MKILDKAKLYLRKKDIERANKDRKELVDNLTKAFFKDKTTSETVYLITEVTKQVNKRLDNDLINKVKDIEAINLYNNKN